MGAPPEKKSIFRTECNSVWDEKKKKIKPNSHIQTLIYRSNIYYSETYQRDDWKKTTKKTKKKTIAQLSIWKCGLGVLDIDTQ